MFDLPDKIMLELTDSCNLNCDYCFRSKRNMKGAWMKWENFIRIISRLDHVNNIAFCGMGEQLIYPQFYEAIEYLADQQKNIDIITNGTILIDYDRLCNAGNVNSITFSVDGTKQEVIRKLCSEYKMENLLKNLQDGMQYSQLKKEVNFVLSGADMEDARKMPSFCSNYKIGQLNVLLPTYNLKWIKKNLVTISNTLNIMEKECKNQKIIYKNPYHQYCFYKDSPIPFISLNGILRVCCDHFLKVGSVGNILEKDYPELYNSNRYQKFRKGVYCERCKMYRNLPQI